MPFHSQVFRNYRQPNRNCSNKEFNIRIDIISQLASQGAIFERTFFQFISDIFLTPKFAGGYRLILNSKKLNEFINIKLEIQRVASKFSSTVLSILWVQLALNTSININSHNKVELNPSNLILITCYKFNRLPFGLSMASFVFTKILKYFRSYLRNKGICSSNVKDLLSWRVIVQSD